jgi:glutamate dehydrogenase
MHYETTRFLRQATYWVLAHRRDLDVEKTVAQLRPGLTELAREAAKLVSGRLASGIAEQRARLRAGGAPEKLATRVATLELLYSGLDIVDVAQSRQLPLIAVARRTLAGGGTQHAG